MKSPTKLFSLRFERPVALTVHATQRMAARGIGIEDVLRIIDTGETRYKDETHLWAFKNFQDRNDNLLCVVLVLKNVVVVKTVMHHFQLET